MKRHSHLRGRASRLIAGWCGLLLYVGAFSPVGMGLIGVIGACDPDHQALVRADASGLQLVLHHTQRFCSHHHGPLARTLTLFAEPVRASQPDHVLQISGGTAATRPQEFLTPAPTSVSQPEVVLLEVPVLLLGHFIPAGGPTHPPPPESGQLLGLRTTVLLI